MADAVQHHLRDRALAVLGFAARFVIDRLGEAFERAFVGRLGRERRRGKCSGRKESDARQEKDAHENPTR